MGNSVEANDGIYELAHGTWGHRLLVEYVRLPCRRGTVVLRRNIEADPHPASVNELHIGVDQVDVDHGQGQQLHGRKIAGRRTLIGMRLHRTAA